jgi:hypothetical protein
LAHHLEMKAPTCLHSTIHHSKIKVSINDLGMTKCDNLLGQFNQVCDEELSFKLRALPLPESEATFPD